MTPSKEGDLRPAQSYEIQTKVRDNAGRQINGPRTYLEDSKTRPEEALVDHCEEEDIIRLAIK